MGGERERERAGSNYKGQGKRRGREGQVEGVEGKKIGQEEKGVEKKEGEERESK